MRPWSKPLTAWHVVRHRAVICLMSTAATATLLGTPGKTTGPRTTKPMLLGVVSETDDAPLLSLQGAYYPGKGWRRSDTVKSFFVRGVRFTLYDARGRAIKTARVQKVQDAEEFGLSAMIDAGPLSGGPFLAISGIVRPSPRPPRPQNMTDPIYQQTVSQYLQSRGIAVSRPRITQVVRADLNGDKRDEVLIAANSPGDTNGGNLRNFYSVVLLRFIAVNGRVRTQALQAETFARGTESDVARYSLLGCPDIDGDGRTEIAIKASFYEDEGVYVFTFNGKAVRRVIGSDSGD